MWKKTSALEEFRKGQLSLHNEYRKKHNADPLILDDNLNKISLEWAKKLAIHGKLRHNPDTKHGENIFYSSSEPEGATKTWYDEINKIDWNKPLEQQFLHKQIGHFTAVVWKDTKKVGISFAKSPDGAYFVVANYFPPGNIVSQISRNIQIIE